ncbi:ESX secretion-associated protein EspG [Nocardia sp. NPDC056100]|uniref:ESX secretion-associated protein EspG n=1 Tax=Nocardia sp. NPDC056100 TaxID=3345712 RepID=UPI0035D7C6D9
MTWEFTDDEFKVLCNRFLDGRLPAPLSYFSRIPLLDDFERELSRLEAGLRERLDSGLTAVFETLRHPEIQIIMTAWRDSDYENPEHRILVHGARLGWNAVMVTQKMGETIYHSAGFTLTECAPEQLPALMIAQLPQTGAGSAPPLPMVFEPPERDPYEARQSLAFDSFDDTAEVRSRAFWAEPAERSGWIRVLQGRSIFGPRGLMTQSALWRDQPDDGRYLFELDQPEIRAVATSPEQLVRRVGQYVDEVLRHMEARGEQQV